MDNWMPGSQDWSWDEEITDILTRECCCCGSEGHYQSQIEHRMLHEGVFWMPQNAPILGSDGRVWDGHHRIIGAYRLGWFFMPVSRMRLEGKYG